MKRYAVVEVFKTLQGEGIHAGRSAVFVRFAGCNLWSGDESTRQNDAERTGARCPRFCDTDFAMRHRMTAEQVESAVAALGPVSMVVLTGGEPMLQLDGPLLEALGDRYLAVETNGTVEPKPFVMDRLNHVCVSPKVPAERLVIRTGAELKVVMPSYRPSDYVSVQSGFEHLLVSPEALTTAVGSSLVMQSVEQLAAQWCMDNPPWRLSVQLHKHLGLQ